MVGDHNGDFRTNECSRNCNYHSIYPSPKTGVEFRRATRLSNVSKETPLCFTNFSSSSGLPLPPSRLTLLLDLGASVKDRGLEWPDDIAGVDCGRFSETFPWLPYPWWGSPTGGGLSPALT